MWRNRIVERTTVKASELLDHEGNWRIHPEAQKAGMVGVLNEVGIIDALTVYRAADGLTVIDGHLRKSVDPEQEWPVDILDVDDVEADYILATKDPLAAAAAADREKLGALLHNVKTGEAGVQALLGELAEREGVVFGNKKEEKYTRNIEAPIYTPKGEKPSIKDLFDDTRTNELIKEIDGADLPEDEKEFLRVAARRHTVLNYKRIADYYAHSDNATQGLMENSALVIIDFNRAIELGYVRLAEEVARQYAEDYGDA